MEIKRDQHPKCLKIRKGLFSVLIAMAVMITSVIPVDMMDTVKAVAISDESSQMTTEADSVAEDEYGENIGKEYETEKEPEIETIKAEDGNGTYAMNDITFPMARPPVYMDESIQMPNRPVESNGWWQSIATQELGNNLILLPLRTVYNIYGLNITETNEFWVNDHETGTLGEALTNQGIDFTLTPEGMDTSRVYDQVIRYSDYSVTTQLCDASGPVMTNTFVKGCPYLFAELKEGQVVSVSSYNITGIYNENGDILTEYNDEIVTDHFGLEITDDDNEKKTKTSVSQFCINLPANTRLKKTGNRIEIYFDGQETYLSVGAMTKREDLATFYKHGYAFVTDTSVTYNFDEETSEVKTFFKAETEVKREGFQNDTIQCLLPHQYKTSNASLAEELHYVSARGTMKAIIGNTFETTDIFYGMVPQFTTPQDDTYSQELITEYLKQMAVYMPAKEQLMNTDAYWQGKGLHTMAMAVLVADQTKNYEYRDSFLECMHYIFEDWFTYSGKDDNTYLYYDDNWGTLYYKFSGYGANVGITDHHFTYGYFVFAAAVLATYDDAFYEKYKTMVDYLVRDYASPYEEDTMFCKFRTFDLYEGHSWAGGYADNDSGNNQESASEALFGWVGMYLWAIRSENEAFKEAAIFGFTTEINAVEQYWFNYDGDNWPENWPHNTVGQVYGSGIYYYTFFDNNTTSLYGIQWLPVAEWITYYGMSEKKEELQKMYEGFLYEIEQQKEHASEADKPYVSTPLTTWQHVFVPVRSLYDADAALEDYWKVMNGEVKDGNGNIASFDYNEQINAYWFAHNMRDLGTKTDKIYALDGVPASVYKNGEEYIAIVWNPTKEDMAVRFTNGKKIVGTAVISAQSLVRLNPVTVEDYAGDNDGSGEEGETGSESGTEKNVVPEENKQNVSGVKIMAANRPYGAKTYCVRKKQKLVLEAIVEGTGEVSQAVRWTTTDKNIASVDKNGRVKAGTKTGSATITAISATDSTKKAEIQIRVVKKAVPNKVLKLKKTKIRLKGKGQQAVIYLKKYTKSTTDKVTYKIISGKKYVSVNKYGVIKSKVNPGKRTVTAKVQVKCGGKKAEVIVMIPK